MPERDARGRRTGHFVLAGGLAVLAIGVGVSVVRHERGASRDESRREAERARYEQILREAAERPPRFEVSYVQFVLSDLDRLTGRAAPAATRYRLIPTEVARRLQTDRPLIRTDFGSLPHSDYLDAFARAFRERRLRNEEIWVVALLVTQTTPGAVARARLLVKRRALRGYEAIIDPSDLVPYGQHPAGRGHAVTWKPTAGARVLIPLCLLHSFNLPRTPENAEILAAMRDQSWWQVMDHVVLAPRRFFAQRPGQKEAELPIDTALGFPLVLEPAAPS